MALYDNTHFQSRPANFAERGYASFSSAVASFVAWNDARRTVNALARLSDHELEDIGLHRGAISGVANK